MQKSCKPTTTIKDNILIVNQALKRGDTREFAFKVPAEFGEKITAVKLVARAKEDDATPAFSCDLNDGITKIKVGKYQVRIAPDKTANLSKGRYPYDIEVDYNTDDVKTIIEGVFVISEDIAR